MFDMLRKSRQLSLIVLDRVGDYLALLRVEMKLQGREMGVQIAGYLLAALAACFALLFIGIAVIVSFWDSSFRTLAAWIVVALYLAVAAGGLALARRHAGRGTTIDTLRAQLRRDAELVRESL